MGDYTAIWRVRVLVASVSGYDASKGARGTSCHATSVLSLFWIVVKEEALKRPSDWIVEDHVPRLHSVATGLGPWLGVCSKADKRLKVVCREQMTVGEFRRYRVECRVDPRDRRVGLD